MATKLKRVIARMHEFDIFGGHGSEFFLLIWKQQIWNLLPTRHFSIFVYCSQSNHCEYSNLILNQTLDRRWFTSQYHTTLFKNETRLRGLPSGNTGEQNMLKQHEASPCIHNCCRCQGKHVKRGHDSLAERSKAVAQGAIPKGRGFEPHSCHFDSRELCLHGHCNNWRVWGRLQATCLCR